MPKFQQPGVLHISLDWPVAESLAATKLFRKRRTIRLQLQRHVADAGLLYRAACDVWDASHLRAVESVQAAVDQLESVQDCELGGCRYFFGVGVGLLP